MKAALLMLLVAGCAGGARRVEEFREHRVVTAGVGLLGLVPDGAEVVVEVDVRRLRENEVLAPVVAALGPTAAARAAAGFDLVRQVDVLVLAAYDLGDRTARPLVLVRGAAVDATAIAASAEDVSAIDATTAAFGPPELRERALALASGGEGMAADRGFLALRDEPMPLRAPGASVRVTARLDADARAAVAEKLGWPEPPGSIAVWLDVVDDLAAVAILGAEDEAHAERIVEGVGRARDRLWAALPRELGLGELVGRDRLRVEARQDRVRVVWVVGPKALGRAAARLCETVLDCSRRGAPRDDAAP